MILQIINTILLIIIITLQLMEKFLRLKTTTKTEETSSLEHTPHTDVEALMIKAEEDAEAAKALKEAEETLQLKAYGINVALANAIEEIREGKK